MFARLFLQQTEMTNGEVIIFYADDNIEKNKRRI